MDRPGATTRKVVDDINFIPRQKNVGTPNLQNPAPHGRWNPRNVTRQAR